MSQSSIDKPLRAFFEPKTLSELGLSGQIITPAVRYEATDIAKEGIQAILSRLPKMNKKPMPMDIDMACVLLDQSGSELERVYYGNIRTDDNSVRHGGDALTGATSFEDKFINQEQIDLHLDKLDKKVHHILIIIASHHRHCLTRAAKGLGILRDNDGVLAHEFELASLDKNTHAIIAWHLKKDDNDWLVHVPLHPIKHSEMPKLLNSAAEFMSADSTRW